MCKVLKGFLHYIYYIFILDSGYIVGEVKIQYNFYYYYIFKEKGNIN